MVEQDRMYRYRRLFPMSEELYLDESDGTIEYALRISNLRRDFPWQHPRQEGGRHRADPGSE